MTQNQPRALEPPFMIRQLAEPGGGLCLELVAEGLSIDTARSSADALSDMERMLGLGREEARALLETALTERFAHERAKVDLEEPKVVAVVGGAGRAIERFVDRRPVELFVSPYVQRTPEAVVGVVWYDPSTDSTGGDGVHAVVRGAMRVAVRRSLARRRPSVFRFVVDVLDAMSG